MASDWSSEQFDDVMTNNDQSEVIKKMTSLIVQLRTRLTVRIYVYFYTMYNKNEELNSERDIIVIYGNSILYIITILKHHFSVHRCISCDIKEQWLETIA